MTIDIGNQLNEKQSNELLSSLNRLIKYVYKSFNDTLNKNNDFENKSLHILFDNEEEFNINLVKKR